MKKYLTSVTAIIAAISLAGCSAGGASNAEKGSGDELNSILSKPYGGKDIGGKPAEGLFGDVVDFFDGAKDAAAGGALMEAATADVVAPGAVPGAAGDAPGEIIVDPGFMPEPFKPQPEPQAGMLTGGEWNDNAHWEDWEALYSSHAEWDQYKSDWKNPIDRRIAVKVTSNGQPLEGAMVSCKSAISSAVTDNKGMAYLFYTAINGATDEIVVDFNGTSKTLDGVTGNATLECELGTVTADADARSLDFMIVCDTTGSMGDELEYLKVELENIVRKVSSENPNTNIRTSVNFYRDDGDEYEVRYFPFTDDIEKSAEAIKEQSANGGGDFPEAVHTALDNAINDHDWGENSTKIMFLVLDAPPHNDAQIIDSVNKQIAKAAEMGIRIVPIASSGIDKSTEYLLRTMAFATGGTYTFLTSDSGIGNSHIEPTVGAFNVEKLSDMMVRIVNGYLE